jgi:hypothetical protein
VRKIQQELYLLHLLAGGSSLFDIVGKDHQSGKVLNEVHVKLRRRIKLDNLGNLLRGAPEEFLQGSKRAGLVTYTLLILGVKRIVMEKLNYKIFEPRDKSLLRVLDALFVSRHVGGKEFSPPSK